MKSNRGAAKRFSKRIGGGFRCKHSHLRHILTKKSTSRKRRLRQADTVKACDAPLVSKLLPYV